MSTNLSNIEVRTTILRSGVSYRELAAAMRITPEWLSKLMSRELSRENEERILFTVEKLASCKRERA